MRAVGFFCGCLGQNYGGSINDLEDLIFIFEKQKSETKIRLYTQFRVALRKFVS